MNAEENILLRFFMTFVNLEIQNTSTMLKSIKHVIHLHRRPEYLHTVGILFTTLEKARSNRYFSGHFAGQMPDRYYYI